MSENPQITAVLEYVEARERELEKQAGHLRGRIEELTAQLVESDAENENLRVTRKTLLALPAPAPAGEPDRPDVLDHPAHQQILAAFADTGQPMRARCSGGTTALHIVPEPGTHFFLPSTRNCPAIVTG
ncbi:hypothetical protein ACF07T_40315 [Streptomyces sp. NPDC015184]|uniref:hypothetical protein n=1 Tax=Streptomyces sp. NPDC015184 TaxID=3364946 RepID=UPI0036F6F6DC